MNSKHLTHESLQLISVHQITQQRFKNKRHACIIQDQIAKDFWFLKRAKFAHLPIENKQPDLSIYIFLERIWMVTEREIEKMYRSGKLLQNYSFLLLCYVQTHLKIHLESKY